MLLIGDEPGRGNDLKRAKKRDLVFSAARDELTPAVDCFQGSKDQKSRTVNFYLLIKSFPLIALLPSIFTPQGLPAMLTNDWFLVAIRLVLFVIGVIGGLFPMQWVRLRCETLHYARAINGARGMLLRLIKKECGRSDWLEHLELPIDRNNPSASVDSFEKNL